MKLLSEKFFSDSKGGLLGQTIVPNILIRGSDEEEPSECVLKWALGRRRARYKVIAK